MSNRLETSYFQRFRSLRPQVVFGFHTGLPKGRSNLSPWNWLTMAWGVLRMPSFDPMMMALC